MEEQSPPLRKQKTTKVQKLPPLTNIVSPTNQTQKIVTPDETANNQTIGLIKKQREAHEDYLQRILEAQTLAQK